jgi:ribosomal protein L32
MTSNQRRTVDQLKSEGFEVIASSKEIVRLTRGADRRVVMADGSQKRGHHVDMRGGRQ